MSVSETFIGIGDLWREWHRQAYQFSQSITDNERGKYGLFYVYGFLKGVPMPDYGRGPIKTMYLRPNEDMMEIYRKRYGKCLCIEQL